MSGSVSMRNAADYQRLCQVFMAAIKRVVIPVLATTVLTACENSADIARKPAVIDEMVKSSLARCVEHSGLRDHLPKVLKQVPTKNLDFLVENGITVCFDERLQQQKYGQGYDIALGAYYGKERIVSIPPTTNINDKSSRMVVNGTYNKYAIMSLARELTTRNYVTLESDFEFLGRYTGCANKCTHTGWNPGEQSDWDQGKVFRASSVLALPPLRS
ncbi:MAG: hypothetical protein Q8K65_07505 [Alphaproteobacteria bacterium]|nr:hypothetical protein [Alphaproteobacteria bacterium]